MIDDDSREVPRHHRVMSVVKAMRLLVRIGEAPHGLAVAEVARETDIPLTTAYHLVNTMLSEGFLSRDDARRYMLGPKVATLAVAYQNSGPAEPLLAEVRTLAETTGETAYLSDWRDNSVVPLAIIEGSNTVRVGGGIHTEIRGVEHARASGKVMLAYLPDRDLDHYLDSHELVPVTANTLTDPATLRQQLKTIRELGYAVEEAEFVNGVGCVAAPILQGRTCVGCFTISAPIDRFELNRKLLVASAKAAAARHSAA
jgi:IclR family transcriptional regulator, acetate operon repressor